MEEGIPSMGGWFEIAIFLKFFVSSLLVSVPYIQQNTQSATSRTNSPPVASGMCSGTLFYSLYVCTDVSYGGLLGV